MGIRARASAGPLDYIQPETFGARGNGSADDSAAFASAFADGRPIGLDATKRYLIKDLDLAASTPCPGIVGLGGQATIAPASGSNSNTTLLRVRKAADFVVDSVKFDMPISTDPVVAPDCNRALWFTPTGGTAENIRLLGSYISGGRFGVAFGGIFKKCRVRENFFTGQTAEGMFMDAPQETDIVFNTFDQGGYGTGSLAPSGAIRTGASTMTAVARNVRISHNTIRGWSVAAGQSAIDCFSAAGYGHEVDHNLIEDCGAGIEMKTTTSALSPDIYQAHSVSHNKIRLLSSVATTGITWFYTGTAAEGKNARNKIFDNRVWCLTAPTSGLGVWGILCEGVSRLDIKGNYVWDTNYGVAVGGNGNSINTAYGIVISENNLDTVNAALRNVGNGNTLERLYVMNNPFLRSAVSRAMGFDTGIIKNGRFIGNYAEGTTSQALEIRDVRDSVFERNTFVSLTTNGVLSQSPAPSNVKFLRNRVVANANAFNMSAGTGLDIQNNDIEIPDANRTVSGAGTYRTADNNRGLASGDPSATMAAALGDTVSIYNAASGGYGKYRCTTAGNAGAAVFKGTEAIA